MSDVIDIGDIFCISPTYKSYGVLSESEESEILFDNINHHHTQKKAYRLPSNIYTLINIHG